MRRWRRPHGPATAASRFYPVSASVRLFGHPFLSSLVLLVLHAFAIRSSLSRGPARLQSDVPCVSRLRPYFFSALQIDEILRLRLRLSWNGRLKNYHSIVRVRVRIRSYSYIRVYVYIINIRRTRRRQNIQWGNIDSFEVNSCFCWSYINVAATRFYFFVRMVGGRSERGCLGAIC